jgi:hypothetical protein
MDAVAIVRTWAPARCRQRVAGRRVPAAGPEKGCWEKPAPELVPELMSELMQVKMVLSRRERMVAVKPAVLRPVPLSPGLL